MLNDYLFLSTQELKDIVPISQNIDGNVNFDSIILNAQLSYIKPAITDDVYDWLQEQYVNDTFTPEGEATIDRIKRALAYYALYDLLPYHWQKIREAGVVNQVGDNYNTVSRNDVQYIRNDSYSKAETNLIHVIKYIKDNVEQYKCDNNKNNTKWWTIS